jgi:hypothetical protein
MERKSWVASVPTGAGLRIEMTAFWLNEADK